MVTKKEFNRIKREKPKSRISQRTREEQKVRNELAKVLIDARKKGVETPYDEYRGKLTKEKQKIEQEKNRILQEIDELVQKKEKDTQEIQKEIMDLNQQKNMILNKIQEVTKQYEEIMGEINNIKKEKPYEIFKHLEENIDSLSYPEMLKALEKVESMLEYVIQSNRPSNFNLLQGDPDEVIDDLRKKYLKVDNNVEMYGYKGKVVHIELPSVGSFKGYKFDYFISDIAINLEAFDKICKNPSFHYEFAGFFRKFYEYIKQFDIELSPSFHWYGDYRVICARRGGIRSRDLEKYVYKLLDGYLRTSLIAFKGGEPIGIYFGETIYNVCIKQVFFDELYGDEFSDKKPFVAELQA